MLIESYGGTHGVRDMHTLMSLEEAPGQAAFGKELYPTVFLKAAVYARNIITAHPFLDGNKRAGISCATVFLENNGYVFNAPEGALQDYAVEIARTKPSLEEIAAWLKKHSKRTSKRK